jgi:hypothetical protein
VTIAPKKSLEFAQQFVCSLGGRAETTGLEARAPELPASRAERVCGESKRIALYMPALAGGGVERAMLNLVGAFSARGHRLDLIECRAEGERWDQVPDGVTFVELRRASKTWSRVRALAADPAGLPSLSRSVLLPINALLGSAIFPTLCYTSGAGGLRFRCRR